MALPVWGSSLPVSARGAQRPPCGRLSGSGRSPTRPGRQSIGGECRQTPPAMHAHRRARAASRKRCATILKGVRGGTGAADAPGRCRKGRRFCCPGRLGDDDKVTPPPPGRDIMSQSVQTVRNCACSSTHGTESDVVRAPSFPGAEISSLFPDVEGDAIAASISRTCGQTQDPAGAGAGEPGHCAVRMARVLRIPVSVAVHGLDRGAEDC